MSNTGHNKLEFLGESSNVVLLPGMSLTSISPIAFDVLNLLMGSQELEDVIERKVQAIIMQKQIEILRTKPNSVFDSFDAIFLEQLNPDDLKTNDIAELETYKNIVDLSNQITFNDELE